MTRDQSDRPGWAADETGVQPGGDVGGDSQVGDSYSVRSLRSDRPGAMIIRTAYPVAADGTPGVFFVQIQTEWMVCSDPRDPGGTEIWSDVVRENDPETFGSAAEAEEASRRIAAELLADGPSYSWHGRPC